MKKYLGSGLTHNSREHSCSKSEEFNFKDTEVLLDKENQPWFKIAHVDKILGI